MRKILFVDDEPRVLEGLKRMLHPMRREWEMAFATSGQQALEILDARPFDVIITDMRMPGMDGHQLLEKVKQEHPEVVRIILSGYSDQELILRSVQSAHQYLAKPCEAKAIQSTVARACALRDLLKDESLITVISRIDSLPSLPSLYTEVMEALGSPDCNTQKIAAIVAKDVGMTAKILHVANSAFFGLGHHVSSPSRAVSLLGMDTIKALIMTVQIFSQFDRAPPPGFSVSGLWTHSMRTGVLAKTISKLEGQERNAVEDAFMGGVLHDVGKLVLVANLAESYRQCLTVSEESKRPLWQVEQEILGTTHAQVGAYLMGLWGLPDPIVESIAFHHSPSQCPDRDFSGLTAVHAADALDHGLSRQNDMECAAWLDHEYVQALRLDARISAWVAACTPVVKSGEADG